MIGKIYVVDPFSQAGIGLFYALRLTASRGGSLVACELLVGNAPFSRALSTF